MERQKYEGNKMIKNITKDEKGSLHIALLFVAIFIIAVALLVVEYFRVMGIHQHLDDELYRASNIAVKQAMYDSYMWDEKGKIDETIAIDAFYDYLVNDLGLNSNLEKFENQELVYTLVIKDMRVDSDKARMYVTATAYASPAFKMWDEKWEIPIKVMSRNIPMT